MSVLIKGMEMPQDGRRHKALVIFEPDGTCKIVCEYSESYSERHIKTFEAIELPPHGRLIDADEMVASVKRQTEIMREIAKEVDKLKPIANSKELDDVDLTDVAEIIEKGFLQEIANAPTILEAEVEHDV